MCSHACGGLRIEVRGPAKNHRANVGRLPPASGTSVTPWQTTYDTHVQGMARQVSRPDGDFDYGYDHGRLQSVTLPAIAGGMRPSVTYGYDNDLGVLRTVTHTQNGVVEYGYDGATRGTLPLSETWRITSDGVVTSRSVSWTHDNLARIASWTAEGGPSLMVSYDGDGMLASVGALTIVRDGGRYQLHPAEPLELVQ